MTITIFPDKRRFPTFLFLWVAILAYFIWSLAHAQTNPGIFNRPGYYIVNGLLLLIPLFYTLTAGVNYLYVMFNSNATLVIDDDGVKDNMTIYSIGRVKWSDIASIERRHLLKIDVLLIKLKDPYSVLANQQWWKRMHLKRALKKLGTPMVISSRLINYNIKDLEREIRKHLVTELRPT